MTELQALVQGLRTGASSALTRAGRSSRVGVSQVQPRQLVGRVGYRTVRSIGQAFDKVASRMSATHDGRLEIEEGHAHLLSAQNLTGSRRVHNHNYLRSPGQGASTQTATCAAQASSKCVQTSRAASPSLPAGLRGVAREETGCCPSTTHAFTPLPHSPQANQGLLCTSAPATLAMPR